VVILYFLISIVGGLALDWAVYSRIVFVLGRPYFHGDGDGYTKSLYPRMVFTVIAIVVMFLTAGNEGANVAVFLCGAGIFLFSPSYAAYRYLMGE
jgi:hypothetical protein